MKTLLAITLVLIAGFHSSGREPGAAMSDTVQAVCASDGVGPGLVPGAMYFCSVEPPADTTFATIDITVDPLGQSLGAYQFELTSTDASFTVVGVEGGEHDAFDHGRPPYFDPVAKQGETDLLILAEYARPELKADQLPSEAVRVATVHVMFTGQLDEQVDLTLTLITAGNADGIRIDAQASYTLQVPERP